MEILFLVIYWIFKIIVLMMCIVSGLIMAFISGAMFDSKEYGLGVFFGVATLLLFRIGGII